MASWYQKSNLKLKAFFNTSGKVYRQLNLKDHLPSMSEDEQLDILATDGLLVKRPILVGENIALVGFQERAWQEIL